MRSRRKAGGVGNSQAARAKGSARGATNQVTPPFASPGVGKGGGPFLCFATRTSREKVLVWYWPSCQVGAQYDQRSYNERGDEPDKGQKLLHDHLTCHSLPPCHIYR